MNYTTLRALAMIVKRAPKLGLLLLNPILSKWSSTIELDAVYLYVI
jgi:hypothetical protein